MIRDKTREDRASMWLPSNQDERFPCSPLVLPILETDTAWKSQKRWNSNEGDVLKFLADQAGTFPPCTKGRSLRVRSSVCNSDRGFRFQVELRISSTFSRPIGRCDEQMEALIWLTERFVPGGSGSCLIRLRLQYWYYPRVRFRCRNPGRVVGLI